MEVPKSVVAGGMAGLVGFTGAACAPAPETPETLYSYATVACPKDMSPKLGNQSDSRIETPNGERYFQIAGCTETESSGSIEFPVTVLDFEGQPLPTSIACKAGLDFIIEHTAGIAVGQLEDQGMPYAITSEEPFTTTSVEGCVEPSSTDMQQPNATETSTTSEDVEATIGTPIEATAEELTSGAKLVTTIETIGDYELSEDTNIMLIGFDCEGRAIDTGRVEILKDGFRIDDLQCVNEAGDVSRPIVKVPDMQQSTDFSEYAPENSSKLLVAAAFDGNPDTVFKFKPHDITTTIEVHGLDKFQLGQQFVEEQ